MKIAFERTPTAICAVLTDAGECDRIINVDRASDAFRAFGIFARDVDPIAYKPLDALFALPRVVLVEIERREGGWCVEVVYWSKGSGTLAQYETEAPSLIVALTRALTDIDV